jgi:transaldolase
VKYMRIFLDTANIESIRKYNDMGVLDGITTNPTLLSKEQGSPEEIMKTIVDMVKGPVSLEVIGTESGQMIEEAHYLKKIWAECRSKNPHDP